MRKSIFIKAVFAVSLLFFLSCNSFYDTTKVYYNNTDDIIYKSELLNFKVPLKINFSGTLTSNSKTYRVSGLLKIKNFSNYQIFLSSKTLGITIARVQFFKDSIIFINNISKTAVKGTLNDLPYLNGLKLDSDKVIRILTGRSFVGLTYKLSPDNESYEYRYPSNFGNVVFNNFGYILSHNITSGSSKINIIYGNYYKKFLLPYSISGEIFTNNMPTTFELKYTTISTLKDNYKQLQIPSNTK